jgi:predicted dehydrogenase
MNDDRTTSRRSLLKGAAVVGAAGAFGPFFPGRVLGANDRVNVAVIGIRSQGKAHIEGYAKLPNARVKTLCDVDENLFADRIKSVEEIAKYTPGTEWDMRRVFDDKEIDAVSFATPNFWHALGAIWAAQAKKHVYVEKPSSHTLWEGRQMVHAARKHDVLMQVGFQNRSRKNTNAAIKFIRDGKLGRVFMARGLCFKSRGDIGRYPDGPMAEGAKYSLTVGARQSMPAYTRAYLDKVHYDMWLGPTSQRPFNPNRFHYNWHWQWEYGNGDTGNQGPHQFDVGRWGLGKDEYPVKIHSVGGLYLFDKSQQETPNIQTSTFEYADGTIFEFATRGLLTNGEGGRPADPKKPGSKGRPPVEIGNIFYGSEGRLEIDANGNWATFMGPNDEPGPTSDSIQEEAADARNTVGTGIGGHFGNFIEAVRSGKREALTCDIEVGHRSSVLPMLANVSYRLKKELTFDGRREQFVNDAQANRMLKRADRKGFVVPNLGPLGAATNKA